MTNQLHNWQIFAFIYYGIMYINIDDNIHNNIIDFIDHLTVHFGVYIPVA